MGPMAKTFFRPSLQFQAARQMIRASSNGNAWEAGMNDRVY